MMANKEVVWLQIAVTLRECEVMANHTAAGAQWQSPANLAEFEVCSELATEEASWHICELCKKKYLSSANSEIIGDLEEKQI